MNDTKRKSGVHGLLVSGTEQQLIDFHMPATMLLNTFERRSNTVHYACMHEDFEFATKLAEKTGVTLQEIEADFAAEEETYKMIVQGQHPGWRKGDREL
jgi:hypothetical protein